MVSKLDLRIKNHIVYMKMQSVISLEFHLNHIRLTQLFFFLGHQIQCRGTYSLYMYICVCRYVCVCVYVYVYIYVSKIFNSSGL